jgi:hypothetical protein
MGGWPPDYIALLPCYPLLLLRLNNGDSFQENVFLKKTSKAGESIKLMVSAMGTGSKIDVSRRSKRQPSICCQFHVLTLNLTTNPNLSMHGTSKLRVLV